MRRRQWRGSLKGLYSGSIGSTMPRSWYPSWNMCPAGCQEQGTRKKQRSGELQVNLWNIVHMKRSNMTWCVLLVNPCTTLKRNRPMELIILASPLVSWHLSLMTRGKELKPKPLFGALRPRHISVRGYWHWNEYTLTRISIAGAESVSTMGAHFVLGALIM